MILRVWSKGVPGVGGAGNITAKVRNALWHMDGYDKLNPYVIQLAYFTQLTGWVS